METETKICECGNTYEATIFDTMCDDCFDAEFSLPETSYIEPGMPTKCCSCGNEWVIRDRHLALCVDCLEELNQIMGLSSNIGSHQRNGK